MTRGKFIVFEGPDGSGKSTQVKMLKEYLVQKGYNVVVTREPGGTNIGEQIREIILNNDNKEMSYVTEAMLYSASRAQLVEEFIVPELKKGTIVICDRFVISSLVYQGIARGLGEEKIKRLNEFALNGLKPDVTLFLSISYEEGLRRKMKQKELDRLENSGDEFHKTVYEGYMKFAKEYEEIIEINGNDDFRNIHNEITKYIDNIL